MAIWHKCCLCGECVSYSRYVHSDSSYVVTKDKTYRGKKFKGERIYFHLECYEKLLPRYKDAGLAQRQSE